VDVDRRSRHRGISRVVVAAAVTCLALAGCGSSSNSTAGSTTNPSAGPLGSDDGATLTMWTRAATQDESQLLVNAYNSTHKNQVKLTVVPTDSYQQKVGSAAGSGQLPDLFASDVVFSPNFAAKNLWLDISSRLKALPYGANLAQAAIKAGTVDGKQYVVPHTIDTSVLFYNKALYQKAGLDPNKPPTTLQELADQANAITKLGNGTYGTYFGGDCPGCLGFTWWPSMWADGAQLISDDGKSANFTDPKAAAVFALYRKMYTDGDSAPGTKAENGATWVAAFAKGNIGIMPMPSSTLGTMPAGMQIGVAPIPGVNGGASTFVGGDVLGISSNSKHADEAWNFIAWSLGDSAQVDILAKNHYQLARTDLSSNSYTSGDPRLVTINSVLAKGQTPVALNFGQTFNDPNGPWLTLLQDVVFGDAGKLDADNKAISASLAGN
jgi:multiple sugar transport system substrate-binding protein